MDVVQWAQYPYKVYLVSLQGKKCEFLKICFFLKSEYRNGFSFTDLNSTKKNKNFDTHIPMFLFICIQGPYGPKWTKQLFQALWTIHKNYQNYGNMGVKSFVFTSRVQICEGNPFIYSLLRKKCIFQKFTFLTLQTY